MAKSKKIIEDGFSSDLNRDIYNNLDRQTRVVLCFADVYKNGTLNEMLKYSEDNDIVFFGKDGEKIDFSKDEFYTLIGNSYIKIDRGQNLSKLDTPLYVYNSNTGYNEIDITDIIDKSTDNIKQQRSSLISKNKKKTSIKDYKNMKKNRPNVFKETSNEKDVKAFKKKHYDSVKKSAENLAGLTLVSFPFCLVFGGIVLELAVIMMTVAVLSYLALKFIPKLFKNLQKRRELSKENKKIKQSLKTHSKDFENEANKVAEAKKEFSNVKIRDKVILTKATGMFNRKKMVTILEDNISKIEASELENKENIVDPKQNEVEKIETFEKKIESIELEDKENKTENSTFNSNDNKNIKNKRKLVPVRKDIIQSYFDEAKLIALDGVKKSKYFDDEKQLALKGGDPAKQHALDKSNDSLHSL